MRITYAIGDVHGRADLLSSLLGFCVRDAASLGASPRFIFLGDICDKGPSSREAYDIVAEALAAYPGSILLKGNHDDMFERSVGRLQRNAVAAWLPRGGVQTLNSYAKDDLELAVQIAGTVHSDHVRMVAESSLMAEEGEYLFVHAGIDPGKTLDDQSERDLIWHREPFMGHVGDLGKVVVHGHSIVGDRPVATENRISLDTGAYASGRLTALRITSQGLSFFQTDGDASSVVAVECVREDRGMGTVLDGDIAPARLAA
jgi:Diadenosine tetraphosphatase and related serine/threonine protein phosphatases